MILGTVRAHQLPEEEGSHKEDDQHAHVYWVPIILVQVSVDLGRGPFQLSEENEPHEKVHTCDSITPYSTVEMMKPTKR
jgi:hypothetical protein